MTTLSSANQTAAAAQPQRSAYFVTITFSDYTLRLWTGIGPKVVSGNTYTGAGNLGSVSPIVETIADGLTGIDSQRLQLQLTGLDTSLMTDVRDYQQQGAPVEILEAQLDANEAVVDGTYSLWLGQIDTMPAKLGASLTVTVICENFLSFMFRGPDGRRRTAADQEDLFAGDLAFAFVGTLPDSIPWGVPTNKNTIPTSVGGVLRGLAGRVAG